MGLDGEGCTALGQSERNGEKERYEKDREIYRERHWEQLIVRYRERGRKKMAEPEGEPL